MSKTDYLTDPTVAIDWDAMSESLRNHLAACARACAGIDDPETTIPELAAACQTSDEAITDVLDNVALDPEGEEWVPLRAARHLVCNVLAKTPGAKP